ncbi:MAG: extracellular solute-binding protein [Burkholderiales bacterium]
MNRRELLLVSGALSAAAVLPSGVAAALPKPPSAAEWEKVLAAARKEGAAGLYSSGIARIEEPRMKMFQERYGFRVNYARPGGGEMVLKRLEAEIAAGRVQTDVCTITDGNLAIYAVKQGWTQPVSVPNIAQLAPAFRGGDDHLIPLAAITLPIVYNPKAIARSDLPRSYADLADPKYKGKVLFGAPENANTTLAWIKAMVDRYGWGYVEKLRVNEAAEMRLQAEAVLAVARGERPLAVAAHPWAYFHNQQGANLEIVWPTEGVVATQACVMMLKGAPHPNAARVFINEVMSGAWQASTMPYSGAYAAAQGVPSPPGLPPLPELRLIVHDPDQFLAQRAELLARWRKIMVSRG